MFWYKMDEVAGDVGKWRFALGGIFDGAFHATLKDGNDFKVMEHALCVGLRGSAFCGAFGYHNIKLEKTL